MNDIKALNRLLAGESRIDETIHELEKSREILNDTLDAEIRYVLEERFKKPYESIKEKYADKIKRLKDSLYEEYMREFDIKLKQLYILKQEAQTA